MAATDGPFIPYPTETQTLLLRAALPRGAAAVEAWRAWCKRVRLDDIDSLSFQLLPQVYLNLTETQTDDPHLNRLKGVYRKTWVEQQMWVKALREVLSALGAAGVDVIVLGGPAIGQRWYSEAATRLAVDHELLIAPECGGKAHAALTGLGWRAPEGSGKAPAAASNGHLRRLQRYLPPQGTQHADLTPRLVREAGAATFEYWRGQSALVEMDGLIFQGLEPASQLLYVCVVGARAASQLGLLWATDAWRIVSGVGALAVDWERLAALANTLGVSLPLIAALTYLRDELDAPVPPETLKMLAAQRVTPAVARFFRLNAAPRGRWGEIPVYLADRARLAERGQFKGPLGLVQYLADRWGLESAGEAPAEAARRFWRKRG